MTEEQKAKRAAKAAQARKQAAETRNARIEKEFEADRAKVEDVLDPEVARVLDYISSEIPKRTPEDRDFLRETREIHFRPYRSRIRKMEMPA